MQWSANFAYAIGLIATDGNLSKDGRHIDFTSKDINLVQSFIDILNIKNNKIGLKSSGYSSKKYFRIQFSNVKLYRFFLDIGLTPNKSEAIQDLTIPNQYFRDFLRGHLDGDGTILTYIDEYNCYKNRRYRTIRLMIYFISVSEVHMRWLRSKIEQLSNLRGSLVVHYSKNIQHLPMWRLKFSKKESLKLLTWIYYSTNLPSLERKRDIAQKAFEMIAKEKRRVNKRILILNSRRVTTS